MSVIVETEVFTVDELSDDAQERALEWVLTAFDDVACEYVSEYLSDALRAANLPGLTITGWDYWRGSVDIEGDVTGHDLASIPPGHFLGGDRFPNVEWVDRVSFGTRRAMDYGHDVWVDLSDDAPFGWADDAFGDVIADAIAWKRTIERGLSLWMQGAYEAETSRAHLIELARMNGYTFTVDGRRFG